jgi:hypothetical protein
MQIQLWLLRSQRRQQSLRLVLLCSSEAPYRY